MHPAGKAVRIGPFLRSSTFKGIMDAEFGPDGRLYLLEYGTAWRKQNADSGLVRIDFNSGVLKKPAPVKAAVKPAVAVHPGLALMEASDCKACHALDKKIVG